MGCAPEPARVSPLSLPPEKTSGNQGGARPHFQNLGTPYARLPLALLYATHYVDRDGNQKKVPEGVHRVYGALCELAHEQGHETENVSEAYIAQAMHVVRPTKRLPLETAAESAAT